MTINSPAAILLAYYACVGEAQGIPREKLRGTIQTDILKEYIAQKEYIFPPEPSMRLVTDMVEFCSAEMPLWHPISISGYHIREAGSTAAQELAFTLADGFTYVEWALERGLEIDDFAPRLSFFFNAHLDFFEEIAKYRAARRIWATVMRDKYGAKNPKSWLMRFHTQTAGVSLTAQQPEVNIVRTALEAMAAVLGGTQSLHTNSYDEALALPTEDAVRIALRTQQVIAHETGAVNTIDPLGGSYYVEHLTNELERQAYEYFERIEKLGGVVAAIKENFFQAEIADAAFRYQREVESEQRVVVGVNRYKLEAEPEVELHRVDPKLETEQVERVRELRGRRDSVAVEQALARLKDDATHEGRNLMHPIVDAARAYVTMGEMCEAFREVWGTWRETPVF
jgi:methylmalonyl-CoA mutase N-terminal domain/subunit